MIKLRIVILFLFFVLSEAKICGQYDPRLDSALKQAENDLGASFNLLFEVLEDAISNNEWELAGKVSKTPLYSINPSYFAKYSTDISFKEFHENIVFLHQKMRYYVTIEADFDQSFEYLIEIRKLLESKTDDVLYPVVMGDVYYIAYWIKHVQHDLQKSREYAELLIQHAEKHKMKALLITAKLGLAELDQHEGKIDLAIASFKEISKEIEPTDSITLNRVYGLLSNAYVDAGSPDTALIYGKLGYDIVPAGNLQLKSFMTIHVARGYMSNGKADSAVIFGEKAITILNEIGAKKEIKDLHALLAEAHELDQNYEQSLYHLKSFLELEQDQASLESAANIANLEAELEKQKSDAALDQEKLKTKEREAEIEKRNQLVYGLTIIIVLSIIAIIVAIRSYLNKKKAAFTIQKQKEAVDKAYIQLEEKNTEILDSITYAKRIQTAILPPQKIVKEYLQDSFILYKPKDIVAGDFYWMEHVNNKVLFAACDCTGHGVPGALVSVVCNNGLNRSVREYGITEPGKILDKTREIVIKEFEKSEEEVRDGMDIALCSLEGNILEFAGAHNPIWIIRKGSEEVEEIKADSQPIGKFEHSQPYTTHKIELEEGDAFYIFSDGYADQFGGEKGKKFKTANFKRLLLSIQEKAMDEQKKIIDQTFEQWRGDIEQIDDVCIIGVRV